jgi:hypothetical protein
MVGGRERLAFLLTNEELFFLGQRTDDPTQTIEGRQPTRLLESTIHIKDTREQGLVGGRMGNWRPRGNRGTIAASVSRNG